MTDTFGTYDFGLTAEQEDRARRLHEESIVVDMLYQGPCGFRVYEGAEPPPATGDLEADFYAVRTA
jgi:hypothetical protein